jgi:hypothetical protein
MYRIKVYKTLKTRLMNWIYKIRKTTHKLPISYLLCSFVTHINKLAVIPGSPQQMKY